MLALFRFKDQLFYGWVVVISLLFIGTVFYGAVLSFGLFFKSIEGEVVILPPMAARLLEQFQHLEDYEKLAGVRNFDITGVMEMSRPLNVNRHRLSTLT